MEDVPFIHFGLTNNDRTCGIEMKEFNQKTNNELTEFI